MPNSIKKTPLVSVIMPVYNGEVFLAEAIKSILAQTYKNIELIIVDDASKDQTWSIVQHFRRKYPKKIFCTRMRKNGGPTAATNNGFLKSKGEFIAVMDSDDISHQKRLAKQVAFLQKNPDVIVVGTQAKVINREGKVIGKKNFPTTHQEIYDLYGRIHPIVHPSIMVRRSLLPSQKYFYKDKYGINSDYYNLFHFLNYGKFANLSEYLLFYRVHGNNGSLKKLKKSYWDILSIRFEAGLKLGYHISIKNYIAMVAQTCIVSLLPEKTLQFLYYSVKGYQISNPSQSKFHLSPQQAIKLWQSVVVLPFEQKVKSFSASLSNIDFGVTLPASQRD